MGVGPNLENWAISGPLWIFCFRPFWLLVLGLHLVQVGPGVKWSFDPKYGLWIILWNPIANSVLFWDW